MSKLDSLELKETKKRTMLGAGIMVAYYFALILIYSTESGDVMSLAMTGILFYCSIFGMVLIAITLIKRYYDLLFTKEGYVRLSFPVKNSDHLKANIRCGLFHIYILLVVFAVCLGISDKVYAIVRDKQGLWGINNLYSSYVDIYTSNQVSSAKMMALATVVISVLSLLILIETIYMSFIFVLTVSSRICGKYNILQKKGVILIAGIIMYNVYFLMIGLLRKFEMWYSYSEPGIGEARGYEVFGRDFSFISFVDESLMVIILGSIASIVMYRVCKNILDKKLDV